MYYVSPQQLTKDRHQISIMSQTVIQGRHGSFDDIDVLCHLYTSSSVNTPSPFSFPRSDSARRMNWMIQKIGDIDESRPNQPSSLAFNCIMAGAQSHAVPANRRIASMKTDTVLQVL